MRLTMGQSPSGTLNGREVVEWNDPFTETRPTEGLTLVYQPDLASYNRACLPQCE